VRPNFFGQRPNFSDDLAENICHELATLVETGGGRILLVIQDGEQHCHSFPLAARSPVFRAMLTAGMTEQIRGRIELKTGQA
jgi:hypothetical protein